MDTTSAVRLLQFGDSMFPIGSFSFSNTLESAIQQGVVSDTDSLRSFVRTATHRAATADGVALLEAHRAAGAADVERIVRADHAVFARKLSEETRTQSVRTGKKLIEVGTMVLGTTELKEWLDLIEREMTPGTYPIALGLVGAQLELDEQNVFAIHQNGVAMTILSASLRLMRIDHLTTQQILFETNSLVVDDFAEIVDASLSDMASFAPISDILAAIHVGAHIRMFMN